MTTIATKTEPRMASHGSQAPATALLAASYVKKPVRKLICRLLRRCRGRRRVGV